MSRLAGSVGAIARSGVDAWQHLFSHQYHRPTSELAILPVLAGIEQRSEVADFFLKSQELIRHAFRCAANDELVTDRLQRHFLVGLIAAGLEQLETAAALQFGEQLTIIIEIWTVWVWRRP